MNKGIVMEITDKNIIVMRSDGRFQRVARKKRSCEIGDEITYADEGLNWRSPSVAGRSAIVAAVVFCLVLFASFQGKLGSPEVVAYISIDINPSVEMGIDIRERVLELRGLNEDGEQLIQAVDYKQKPLETVTAGILSSAEQTAFSKGEAEIVIASTVIDPSGKVSDTQIAEKLRIQVTEYIQTSHPTQVESYQIASFAAPQEVREAAAQNGVSMGKYTVYLNAKSSGAVVTLDELKTKSVLNISKENPEVAQIMAPDRVPTKEAIKQLVEEEKSGELDKRLQEWLKNREQADKNRNNTENRQGNNDFKTDEKKSTVPSIEGKTNRDKDDDNDDDDRDDDRENNRNNGRDHDRDDDKDDDDSKNSGSVNVRPGSINPSVTQPGSRGTGTGHQGDNRDDRDDDGKWSSGSNNDSRKSQEERRREAEEKRLKEQKKKEEEARKKQEEQREKDEERKKKQEEDLRKRLEDEKKKAEEKRKKEEEKREKAEDKRKENEKDREDDRKNRDDERDSREDSNSERQALRNDNGEWTKTWHRSLTLPLFNERQ
ncbi:MULTISPECIES: anti-sigma factor domain-containing protein [unclassified Paenibacillus]|uniref:anti-sigma factor domain-containing protein n=1 Tax=unclassified Paenibacillus TaxID=185978 RepID=UPI001AEA8126|nr:MULTISPECIES: anti-sigma factor domain-containing protein [unclassified Paenibacillus]MBP1157347.1 hypothetical protein [Paenibacillus sp. PvP091]MBP1171915.1 hypothetical protein [Paenibacillus sp. PvR098]MBP2438296.1 hypothetical protein [Paenibacillus sp. PvP052]